MMVDGRKYSKTSFDADLNLKSKMYLFPIALPYHCVPLQSSYGALVPR